MLFLKSLAIATALTVFLIALIFSVSQLAVVYNENETYPFVQTVYYPYDRIQEFMKLGNELFVIPCDDLFEKMGYPLGPEEAVELTAAAWAENSDERSVFVHHCVIEIELG